MSLTETNGKGNDFEIINDDSHSPPLSESALDDDRRLDSDSSHAASDSELQTGRNNKLEQEEIAKQLKGPSSDALESECVKESTQLQSSNSSCDSEFEKDTEIIEQDEIEAAKDEQTDTDALIAAGWIDILDSNQIYRKIIKTGASSSRPKNNDLVTIRVNGTLSDGTKIDQHDNISFLLGHSDVIQAWELCVRLMLIGEVDHLRTTDRFAYGPTGREPDIPPNSHIMYEIELLSKEEGPDVLAMTAEERVELGEMKKERGNYYYSRSEFREAIEVYQRAVTYLDPLNATQDFNQKDTSLLEAASSKIFCNIAAAHLKLDSGDATVQAAKKCLKHDPYNVKAWFRLGKGYALMEMYEDAIKSLARALQLDPDATITRKELDRIKGLAKRHEEKERKLYSRMLGDVRQPRPAPKWKQLVDLFRQNLWAVGIAFSIVVAVWFYHLFVNS